VLIEAGLAGEAAVAILAVAAEGDEERVAEAEIAADPFRDLVPIHLRHADVQEDDVRPVPPRGIESSRAIVCRPDVVTVVAQEVRECLRRVDVVVDDEDPTLWRRGRWIVTPREACSVRGHGFSLCESCASYKWLQPDGIKIEAYVSRAYRSVIPAT